jgi:hypothetical protein
MKAPALAVGNTPRILVAILTTPLSRVPAKFCRQPGANEQASETYSSRIPQDEILMRCRHDNQLGRIHHRKNFTWPFAMISNSTLKRWSLEGWLHRRPLKNSEVFRTRSNNIDWAIHLFAWCGGMVFAFELLIPCYIQRQVCHLKLSTDPPCGLLLKP